MSRRPVSILTALVCAALLAGCGTGLHAKTYEEKGRTDGASADVGGLHGVAVRNLHVTGPASGSIIDAGGVAFVAGGLVNNATESDTLIGASSAAASAVVMTVAGAPVQSIAIPARGTALPDWGLQLQGLTRAVHAGQHVTVTLSFEHAGHVTLLLPIRAGDNGLEDREPAQDPYGE